MQRRNACMRRRHCLATLAALPTATWADSKEGSDLESPYEGLDWQQVLPLHSMSHQHQGLTAASLEVFRGMGYGHMAFSNYYPSKPTYPLQADFTRAHPEVIAAPNAEHHSFLDSGLHCNALGSLLSTGFGREVPAAARAVSPILQRFEGLNLFAGPRPWEGVYRLDVGLQGDRAEAEARLDLRGAVACKLKPGFEEVGAVQQRSLKAGSHSFYLRLQQPVLELELRFDLSAMKVTQLRLMQGCNRPWRESFKAALDGEMVEGKRQGGLLHADGGGLTLNHPTGALKDYAPMLDFDERVLGIEVWNQLTSGFGSSRGFYDHSMEAPMHFYRLWDEILRSGRRCWGFFVKDHNTFGRGRNVLLLPPMTGLEPPQREALALRAYRRGCFFGAVSALAHNEAGEVVAPYDQSGFAFQRLEVIRDAQGRAQALEVAVGGQDAARRPQVQIRLIGEGGVLEVADAARARLALPREASGRLQSAFFRVEAVAYPRTHLQGRELRAEQVRGMSVGQLSRLHDRLVALGSSAVGKDPALRQPLPIADLIFSQPLRRV
jgi:hypothetical protein